MHINNAAQKNFKNLSLGWSIRRTVLNKLTVTSAQIPVHLLFLFLRTSCEGSFCIADLVPQLAEQHPNATIELAISLLARIRLMHVSDNVVYVNLNSIFSGIVVVAANLLAEQLPRLVIPDVEQRFRRAEHHAISTAPPNRISWTMKNLDLGFIGDLSGAVNIVVPFNLTGQAEILAEIRRTHVERSANGSAHVTSLSCHTTIRVVQVTNHNGGLFGLAVTVFKEGVSDNVRQLLQGLICKKVRKYIDEELNEKLAEAQTTSRLSEAVETNALRATKIPTGDDKGGVSIVSLFGENLTKDFFIDFRLKEDPVCGVNTVSLASLGEISPLGLGGTPFGPVAMTWPPVEEGQHMLALLVSDFLPNSLFYHAYKQRLMKILLTSRTPGVAPFLRTSCEGSFCIADLVPQLAEQHPNATIELAISATRAPALLFSEKNGGVISVSISAVVVVYVVKEHHRRQTAVVDLDAVAEAQLSLQHQNISGSVQLTRFDLRNRAFSSAVSNDELSDISLLVSQLIENMLNQMLHSGFPLPIPHVLQLHAIKVKVLARRLFIQTDISVDERRLSKIAARTLFNGPQFGGPDTATHIVQMDSLPPLHPPLVNLMTTMHSLAVG